jgi:hypothetical protein
VLRAQLAKKYLRILWLSAQIQEALHHPPMRRTATLAGRFAIVVRQIYLEA